MAFPFEASILFSLLAALVTLIGLWLARRGAAVSGRIGQTIELASAGMLATLCLVHIIPEAFAMSSRALLLVASGFAGGWALYGLGPRLAGSAAGSAIALTALGIHSTLDGAVYAISFAADEASGLYSALSLIAHEVPEGMLAFALFTRRGWKSGPALLGAFVIAALTTPLGAIAGNLLLQDVSRELTGNVYALSAGLLMFVATGPLLSGSKGAGWRQRFLPVLAGIFLALLLHLLPLQPHNHDSGVLAESPHTEDQP